MKDIMNLFLTSKIIHKLQISFPFLVHIGQRISLTAETSEDTSRSYS